MFEDFLQFFMANITFIGARKNPNVQMVAAGSVLFYLIEHW